MPRLFFVVSLYALAAPIASAQTFPIIPLTDPVFPADHPELSQFEWSNAQGTMTRLGDLDNDGRPDLLVYFPDSDYATLSTTATLWLFPALPQGGFDQPRFLSVPATTNAGHIHDIAIHDHNHDGINDIVFLLDAGPTLVPWLATPDGFVEGTALSAAGQGFESDSVKLIIRDLDHDGLDDNLIWNTHLKVGAWFANQNAVPEFILISDVHNDFDPPADETNFDVAVSDFEADGDLDILIRLGPEIYWVENTAPRTYAQATNWGVRASHFGADHDDAAAFADVNGDGLTDIVQYGYEQDIYDTDGYASFIAPFTVNETRDVPFFPVSYPSNYSHLAKLYHPDQWAGAITSPGDLDGDGSDEVILTPDELAGTGLCIFDLANTRGRSGAATHYAVQGDGTFNAPPNAQAPGPRIANTDQYADINNDGVRDRITVAAVRREHDASQDQTLNSGIMLWGLVSNPYAPDQTLDEKDTITAISDMTHLTHADADLDGEPEIILTLQQNLRLVDQDQEGVYRYNRDTRFDEFSGFRSRVASFDDDPTPDLISMRLNASGRPTPAVYMNIDPGAFGQVSLNEAIDYTYFMNILQDLNIDANMNGDSSSFTSGDVNADGYDDLIVRAPYFNADTETSYDNAAVVWLSDTHGTFTLGPASPLTPTAGPNAELIETIDLDHDATLDIISIASAGNAYLVEAYNNTGAGQFKLAAQIPLNAPDEEQTPYCLWVDDIDNDGYQDALVLSTDRHDQSIVSVIYAGPDGLAAQAQTLTGRGAGEVTSADIDGNGLSDIITCSYYRAFDRPNSVTVNLQIAPRQFLPQISINDLDMTGIDTIDLNHDGLRDIIACEGTQSGAGRNIRVFYSVPAPCPADLNLDGTLNFFDITLFIQLYLDDRPLADLNHDGILNFFDVSAMIVNYTNACP